MTAAPRAIYRLQLTPDFGFGAARAIVPYLHGLGVSHLYLSPVFASRSGSTHGYDVVDHGRLNEELGGESAFEALTEACRAHGMGIVLDIVPNHMAVATTDNPWWMDVLQSGPASPYARYFDIDWTPTRATLRDRLLVPVLGEPLGTSIDERRLSLQLQRERGAMAVRYGDLDLPLEPRTWRAALEAAFASLDVRGDLDGMLGRGLAALVDQFSALPPPRAASADMLAARRERLVSLQAELRALLAAHPDVADRIDAALARFNELADAQAADRLAVLLAAQPYRLAFWRVSGEEINYRRFFDVNELAALRVEEPEVFEATHALVGELWRSGRIDGVRVDHADGLYDPQAYFARLRTLLEDGSGRRPWIVVEKILATGEALRPDWQVDGTTGYEFLALVTGWLMDDSGAAQLENLYRGIVGRGPGYEQVACDSRRLVMRTTLAAEISMLAARLDRLAQRHRDTADFTLFDLREAIVEVLAAFPVYRTYVRDGEVGADDAAHVRRAVGIARGRKQAERRALDFLEQLLLGGLSADPLRGEDALEFVKKFQQVSSPVMAKGIEDTACYRHPALLAMNEVGGDPQCRGFSTGTLHRANAARLREHPHSVLASSTHDTKRGEDARHRLAALTEMPAEWAACVRRWRRLKGRMRVGPPLGAAQEYLLLQALLAIWPSTPPGAGGRQSLRERLQAYAVKSAREAKQHTSWLDPDEDYEKSLCDFVARMVPDNAGSGFERYFQPVLDEVALRGMLGGLSAVVLKLTAPGVPDLYQGNELPALALVDPDNRNTPDFARHAEVLEEIQRACQQPDRAALVAELRGHWRDGRLKLLVTWRLLALRAERPTLFEAGDYQPLEVTGEHATRLCAYARADATATLVVAVSRWTASLAGEGEARWGDARIVLPPGLAPGTYMDVFTGQAVQAPEPAEAPRELAVAPLLSVLPVCALLRVG